MHELIAVAIAPTLDVVRAIRPDQLDAPTPCRDWTVQQLIDHQLEWGPALVASARKESTQRASQDLETHFADLQEAWATRKPGRA